MRIRSSQAQGHFREVLVPQRPEDGFRKDLRAWERNRPNMKKCIRISIILKAMVTFVGNKRWIRSGSVHSRVLGTQICILFSLYLFVDL